MQLRLSKSTPDAKGKHADPAECRDDADPLVEPRSSCELLSPTKAGARSEERAERHDGGRDTVPTPSTLAGCRGAHTGSKSCGRYSKHHRHRAKLVDDSRASALRHPVGNAGWITVDRIGWPDRGTDQSQAGAFKQPGCRRRTG